MPEPIDFEVTIRAHNRDFVLSPDIWRARGVPHDRRAVISPGEVAILKDAAGNRRLPVRLVSLLHGVKSTIGGEVLSCILTDTVSRS